MFKNAVTPLGTPTRSLLLSAPVSHAQSYADTSGLQARAMLNMLGATTPVEAGLVVDARATRETRR